MRFATRLLVAALTLVSAVPLLSSVARADVTPSLTADQGLRQCLATTHALNLVTLVDTSGSLGFATGTIPPSDPHNARVTALEALLHQLTGLTKQQGVAVNLAMAGFDTTATTYQTWSPLTSSSLPALSAVAQSFATKNTGGHTNFLAGLDQAWKLISQVEQSGTQSCSAVVWFTDGQIDLGTGASLASQVQQMCASSSPAATLARNGVFTFAVGLGDFGGMTPAAARELKSYVQGGANDVVANCGNGAMSATSGGFFRVASPQQLLFAFEGILNPSIPANPPSIVSCRLAAHCSSAFSFVVDANEDSFTLTAAGPIGAEVDTVFTGPNGVGSIQLSPTNPSVVIGGLTLHYESLAANSVIVTGNMTSHAAKGLWKVRFLDAQQGPVLYWLQMHSPFELRVSPGTSFVQTQNKLATLQLVNATTGMSVRGVSVQGLSARIAPAGVLTNVGTLLNLSPSGDDRWSFNFTNDFSEPLLQLTTTGFILVNGGAQQIPVGTTTSVAAPLPADYPTVSLTHQSAHSTQGASVAFTFAIRATNSVTGCVRFRGLSVQTPDHLKFKTTSSLANDGTCLTVAPGAEQFVTVSVKPKTEITESAAIATLFEVRGRPSSQWLPVTMNDRVFVIQPLNIAKASGLTILLIALGVLLLLGVLYAFNKRFGRLIPEGEFLSYFHAYVTVTSTGKLVNLATGGWDEETLATFRSQDPGRSTPLVQDRQYVTPDGSMILSVDNRGFFGSLRLLFGQPSASVVNANGFPFLLGDKNDEVSISSDGQPIVLPTMEVVGVWMFVPDRLATDRLMRNEAISRSEMPDPPFLQGDLTLVLNARRSDLTLVFDSFLKAIEENFVSSTEMLSQNIEE